jgi:hypothetical protein
MKKNIVLAALFSLFALGVSVSAQKAPDFSGKWNLDKAKSTLSDREKSMIESQSMTVTQTAADIKYETATKRTPPPADAPAGGPPGGGQGRGGMGGGGDQTMTFKLDGKETTVDMPGMGGQTMPVKMTGKWEGSKLVLSTSRTFTTPNGDMTSTTKQTWELSADGKTLTVNSESTSPRGSATSTKIYTKN